MPSTYAKQSFLNRNLAGTMNASLNGVPMRLNPTSIDLGYTVKTSETPTLGGLVVQVFGVQMSDLLVSGTFGMGGYKEQVEFLTEMNAIASAQGTPAGTLDVGSGPVRFLYPNRGFDFQVYLKAYTSPNGLAIDYENDIIAPEWSLTLFVDTDNTGGRLTKAATDAYITRLSEGLGYKLTDYNGQHATADIAQFLTSQGFTGNLKGYANAAFGGPSANAAAAGGAGGSATPGNGAPVAGVSAPNRTGPITVQVWATDVLNGIGAPVNDITLNALGTWYQAEGGWSHNSDKFNPLNTSEGLGNHPELGAIQQSTGNAAYPTYAQGVQAAVDTINQSNMSAIKAAFMAGNSRSAIIGAIQVSPWSTSHYGGALDSFSTSLSAVIGTA